MKILKFLVIFFCFTSFCNAAKITMKYGGQTVDTTIVQNGNFMSMVGSYIGTNVMTMKGEEMRTNFVCTLIYQTDPVPANTSRQLRSLISNCNQLNKTSLNLLEVGLRELLKSKEIFFPLRLPPVIRILFFI